MKESVLRRELALWSEQVKQALLRAENRKRIAAQALPLPTDTKVWLYTKPQALLGLLTLKVWTMRYCVPLDFILGHLLYYFRNYRRMGKNGLQIGIPVAALTGPRARKYIEECVQRAYPYGENFRKNPPQQLPIKTLQYSTPEEFVEQYHLAIRDRQKRAQSSEPQYVRNFRKEKTHV